MEIIEEERKQTKWHTRKWYKQNYGIDPETTGIPPKLVKNPHYSKAPKMKLWRENQLKPYKSDQGIQEYQRRSASGKKAFETKRNNLVKWWEETKQNDPEVKEIIKRMYQIHEQIGKLHRIKEMCRGHDVKLGIEHICDDCDERSCQQDDLRDERENLFDKLEEITGESKEKIQEARKYFRETKQLAESTRKMEVRA